MFRGHAPFGKKSTAHTFYGSIVIANRFCPARLTLCAECLTPANKEELLIPNALESPNHPRWRKRVVRLNTHIRVQRKSQEKKPIDYFYRWANRF